MPKLRSSSPRNTRMRANIDGDRPVYWQQRSACRDVDPELFHPIGHVSGTDLLQADRAKAICARCPVRQQCLEFAIDNGEQHGIFGGMDERERREYVCTLAGVR